MKSTQYKYISLVHVPCVLQTLKDRSVVKTIILFKFSHLCNTQTHLFHDSYYKSDKDIRKLIF